MANRYIIHGAAVNGNGTASNVAANPGENGAWNDINIFEGTPPPAGSTLPAGTTVYIRSKDAAGADITRAMTGARSIGSTAGTFSAWITWIIDDGAVWSGVSGTISYTNSAHSLTAITNNRFVAKNRGDLSYIISGNNYLYSALILGTYTEFEGLVVNSLAQSGASGIRISSSAFSSFVDCDFLAYKDAAALFLVGSSYGYGFSFVGCNIRLDNVYSTALINNSNQFNRIYMSGCKIYGTATTSGSMVLLGSSASYGMIASIVNTSYPPFMRLSYLGGASPVSDISSTLCDGLLGSEYLKNWGYISSRNDGAFPTLNATLPDADPFNCISNAYCYTQYPAFKLIHHAE